MQIICPTERIRTLAGIIEQMCSKYRGKVFIVMSPKTYSIYFEKPYPQEIDYQTPENNVKQISEINGVPVYVDPIFEPNNSISMISKDTINFSMENYRHAFFNLLSLNNCATPLT
jgi:hypothetical protein